MVSTNKKNNIALVFDDLIQFGGAERLFLQLLNIYPHAHVYTSVISKEWEERLISLNINYTASFMQKLPFKIKLNRVYSVFLLHLLAFQTFNFKKYDLVLSMSTRFAHTIKTKDIPHVCYMNSPGRMFWEPYFYFENEKIYKIAKVFLHLPLSIIRVCDYFLAQQVDYFIANSKTPQKRIQKYYGKTSTIIYPFIDCKKIDLILKNSSFHTTTPYFLVLTRLVAWKKVEIAIKTCEKLNLSLKIIGQGSDILRLKKLVTSSKIEFLGYVSESEKYNLIKNARAVIITQFEDFGIVPLESMYCGTPVIALNKGGVLETVLQGETGEFFSTQSVEALENVIKTYNKQNYNSQNLVSQAKKFDVQYFNSKITHYINSVY